MLKDCIKEIWRLHEVVLCQNILGVHYIEMFPFKGYWDEYSLVIICKCHNEEIKVAFRFEILK